MRSRSVRDTSVSVATSREAELDATKRGKWRESCHRPHRHHLQLGLVHSEDLRASMLEEKDGLFSGDVPFDQFLSSWNLHVNGRFISVSMDFMFLYPPSEACSATISRL